MKDFYVYFFLRQILQVVIFISDLSPITKIGGILTIDLFGKENLAGFDIKSLKNGLNANDRVGIVDTIGSLFSYFQCIIIMIENKMISKNFLTLLLTALLFHIMSVFNYLYNPTGDLESAKIFPDLVKPILITYLVYTTYKNGVEFFTKTRFGITEDLGSSTE